MVRKFRVYAEKLSDGRWKCIFCPHTFGAGTSGTRIRWHLSGVEGEGVEICRQVPKDVQEEALQACPNKKRKTIMSDSEMDEMIRELQQGAEGNVSFAGAENHIDDMNEETIQLLANEVRPVIENSWGAIHTLSTRNSGTISTSLQVKNNEDSGTQQEVGEERDFSGAEARNRIENREEEDTIIKLHEMLGNRSAIAARLTGCTDNEMKNVWHTHLKKRLKQNHVTPEIKGKSVAISRFNHEYKTDPEIVNSSNLAAGSDQTEEHRPISPQQCSSDTSSVTTGDDTSNNMCMKVESSDDFTEVDENFWSEVLSADNSSMVSDFSAIGTEPQIQFLFSPLLIDVEQVRATNSNVYDSMGFWHNLFTRAGELPVLPEI